MLWAAIQIGNIDKAITEILHRVDHPAHGVFKRAHCSSLQEENIGLTYQACGTVHEP
jgi:hypothetical protein